jgi:hypothetical protein
MSISTACRTPVCVLAGVLIAVLGGRCAQGADREPDPAYWTNGLGRHLELFLKASKRQIPSWRRR